jgi:hypothetical protein
MKEDIAMHDITNIEISNEIEGEDGTSQHIKRRDVLTGAARLWRESPPPGYQRRLQHRSDNNGGQTARANCAGKWRL